MHQPQAGDNDRYPLQCLLGQCGVALLSVTAYHQAAEQITRASANVHNSSCSLQYGAAKGLSIGCAFIKTHDPVVEGKWIRNELEDL